MIEQGGKVECTVCEYHNGCYDEEGIKMKQGCPVAKALEEDLQELQRSDDR